MNSVLKVKVVANGPLKIEGSLIVELPDGTVELKEKNTFLCRCGHSANKPFCDGMHRKKEFVG